MNELNLTIAAVEREVGLSKDVLRVWERRYGFPAPARDSHGERLYPLEQVARLRLVKRLMDQGLRPGRLLMLPAEALQELVVLREPVAAMGDPGSEGLERVIELLLAHDASGCAQALQQRLVVQGLGKFVQDTAAPLAHQVGVAWEHGRLDVFEEHLFTELLTRVLRQAIAAVPPGRPPRVLLTTLPGEPHVLGLLMAEAMLALEGADCVGLGTETPLLQAAQAARAHGADVLALSFSAAFPARQVPPLLKQMRAALPESTQLWVGGGGTARLHPAEGVRVVGSLEALGAAVRDWRALA
jgi:methanogenic corrinoid protein MtbC1